MFVTVRDPGPSRAPPPESVRDAIVTSTLRVVAREETIAASSSPGTPLGLQFSEFDQSLETAPVHV
jgi:hypothetical protein